MFKLTQLICKGKLVKELNEIQKEKERIQKELDKCEFFPDCPYMTRSCIGELNAIEELSTTLMLVFLGKASFESINQYFCKNLYLKDEEIQDYFKDLGNYFLNLSGNLETRKPLEEKLAEFCRKENELKEKLGIK